MKRRRDDELARRWQGFAKVASHHTVLIAMQCKVRSQKKFEMNVPCTTKFPNTQDVPVVKICDVAFNVRFVLLGPEKRLPMG